MNGDTSVLDRLAATLEEAAQSLWRRRPFVAATVLAVAVTLAFPGGAAVLLDWTRELAGEMAARERLRVFLLDGAASDDVAAIRAALESSPGVSRVELVSSERARADFLARFPDLERVVAELPAAELALPASLEAWGDGAAGTLEEAARRVREMPGVEEVRSDPEAAARLAKVRSNLAAASSVVALLALAVAALGIGNVIRMGALARREQLAVMRLVGAPRLHVRAPFVLEGLVQGALGGALAAGALAVARWALSAPLSAALPASSGGIGTRAVALLVAAPALAGALAAALAVDSVLRQHARLER